MIDKKTNVAVELMDMLLMGDLEVDDVERALRMKHRFLVQLEGAITTASTDIQYIESMMNESSLEFIRHIYLNGSPSRRGDVEYSEEHRQTFREIESTLDFEVLVRNVLESMSSDDIETLALHFSHPVRPRRRGFPSAFDGIVKGINKTLDPIIEERREQEEERLRRAEEARQLQLEKARETAEEEERIARIERSKTAQHALIADLPSEKLNTPAKNALGDAGIKSIKQIADYTEEQLLNIDRVGPLTIRLLVQLLEEYGLMLKVKVSDSMENL